MPSRDVNQEAIRQVREATTTASLRSNVLPRSPMVQKHFIGFAVELSRLKYSEPNVGQLGSALDLATPPPQGHTSARPKIRSRYCSLMDDIAAWKLSRSILRIS
jgi:hypothetical protein